MAWTWHNVQYQVPQPNGTALLYVNASGQADASDETDKVLVDASALLPVSPAKIEIEYLRISAGGVFVRLEWDATTDDLIVACPTDNTLEYPPGQWAADKADLFNGSFIKDPASTGSTGDILLTTLGGAAGDGVSIQARLRLHKT